jgi:hypothetical protein
VGIADLLDIESQHTFPKPGTYPVTITVTDQGTTGLSPKQSTDGKNTITLKTTAIVVAISPVVQGLPTDLSGQPVAAGLQIPPPNVYDSNHYEIPVAAFQAAAGQTPSDFIGTINWGDGSAKQPDVGQLTFEYENPPNTNRDAVNDIDVYYPANKVYDYNTDSEISYTVTLIIYQLTEAPGAKQPTETEIADVQFTEGVLPA